MVSVGWMGTLGVTSRPSFVGAVRPDESPLGLDYGAMNAVIT